MNRRLVRVSRSIDKYVYFNFKSFGRDFKLKLKPIADLTSTTSSSSTNNLFVDKSIFKLELNNKTINLNDLKLNHNFYEGVLLDEPFDSNVNGLILDGLFYGTIKSKKLGQFFIQSSSKAAATNGTSNLIIYHENDVNLNALNHDNDTSSLHCGSSNSKINKWLTDEQKKIFNAKGFDPFSYIEMDDLEFEEKKKYTKEWNNQFDNNNSSHPPQYHILNRQQSKRDLIKQNLSDENNQNEKAVKLNFPDKRTVCNLYLKVDHVLYNEIFKNEGNQVSLLQVFYI